MQINEAFDKYYGSIYGNRWPLLRDSLMLPSKTIPYCGSLKKPYMLDRASVLAAQSLRLPEQGIILDACAAPGGKSLVIASAMGKNSKLVSNELSGDRLRILKKILDGHLDEGTRTQVSVTCIDAARMGSMKNEMEKYDAILIDAPCSSERHVIQDEKALKQWTAARPRFLSGRQWSLLSAAFLMLKPGGSLVYSTCAITPEENDSVAKRLFRKYENTVAPDEPDFCEGEKTEYGRIILPDACGGIGPMYVARFIKT